MKKILFLIIVFLVPLKAQTQELFGLITNFRSSSEIEIKLSVNKSISTGELLLIRDQDQNDIVGYAEVIKSQNDSNLIIASIRSHANNKLIRVHDLVEMINLIDSEKSKNQMNQGRHDLIISGNKNVSSKFKPQVYLGALTGQTAATVEKKEFFIGLGMIAYGISENFQLSTQPFLDALGESNVHLKWQAFQNEDYRISLGAETRFNFDHQRAIGSVSLYWDTYSNSKFLTYNQLRFTTGESELYDREVSAEFSVNYGYITNQWNRILFGPNIDFQQQTVGGLLSYQWVWDEFTAAFSLQSRDFLNLKFGNDGYLAYLDFWWRF